jgi:hypothetical protein
MYQGAGDGEKDSKSPTPQSFYHPFSVGAWPEKSFARWARKDPLRVLKENKIRDILPCYLSFSLR